MRANATAATTRNRDGWLLAAGLLMLVSMLLAAMISPDRADASAFPGANGRIVFASDRNTGTGVNNPEGDVEIFTTDPNGTGLKQLTTNTTDDLDPAYSADGKKIAFARRVTATDIFVMNADGTGQINLTKSAAEDQHPAFSPNGQKIVFDSFGGGEDDEIIVMNADGSGQTKLTSNSVIDRNPTFSPDGQKIAYEVATGTGGVFMMNANGTNPTLLTPDAGQPSFSPDGQKIAFSSNRDGAGDPNDFDVFVMSASGANPVRLTNNRARDDDPAFSPDGKKIAFVSNRDGGDEDIFVMDPVNEGSGALPTNITPNTSDELVPDWQPAGANFTVTTATDLGDGVCDTQCTLREAINTSNNTPGSLQNTIRFNIAGSGVQTITPISVLPPIKRSVLIDGYTQPGASPNTLAVGDNAVLKIELNGTNVTGGAGLSIQGTSGGSVIRGLAINRFGNGVSIDGDTVGNRIEGNFIGTDPTGTIDRGNNFDGVSIFNGPSGNVIGGATPAARNIFSGNDDTGIFVSNANGNTIQGNYVGTDKSGTQALGNQDGGVFINDGADGNTVGGTTSASRNVVSGNGFDGIDVVGGSAGNKVLGNRVGTTASGTSPLGNEIDGVGISGAFNNSVGDGSSGGTNTIAFNGNDGIDIAGSAAIGNAISRNSIFQNTGLGIDLSGGFEDANGVTANDPGDIDGGPNNLQNSPALTSAKKTSTGTTIAGTLGSATGKTYKIEFFSNPSGNEGKTFLGEKSVTTNSSGNASITFSTSKAVSAGQTITATATDPAGNTSEFSAPKTVVLASGSALAPETTKVSGPSGVTKSPTAHFKFDSPDPEATFECSLDGGAYRACSSPENINGLSTGEHTFEVRAKDRDGNVDQSAAAWRWEVSRNRK